MNTKHVTELSLSKALFEAGITKDFESEFYWVNKYRGVDQNGWTVYWEDQYELKPSEDIDNQPDAFAALLLSELLEIMPRNMPKISREIVGHGEIGWEATCEECREVGFDWYSPLVALSSLATYLLREGKFNNNAK